MGINGWKNTIYKYILSWVGESAQESIYNALCVAKRVAREQDDAIVLIHNGVRPMISRERPITQQMRIHIVPFMEWLPLWQKSVQMETLM